MTAPVPVYPDSNIAGSRRTERGACYLTPIPEIRNIIVYIYLHYAEKHRMRLLVLVILCNHAHWEADDPFGNYPAFIRDVHSKITEVLNDYFGRSGPMWANCKPQRTRILDDKTIEEKLLYAATNATWHGIEFRSRTWDGFVFSPEDIGKVITATCPEYLAKRYRNFPDEIEYVVPKPSCYADRTDADARRHFRKRRNQRERRLRVQRGNEFIGREKALEAGPDQTHAEPESSGNKLFDGTPESMDAGWGDLNYFRGEYGNARRKFLRGKRRTRWPHGTYAMRVWHRCPTCEPLT